MPVLLADELMSPPPNKELIFPNYNYTLEKMPFMQQLSQRMKLFSSHQNIFKDNKKNGIQLSSPPKWLQQEQREKG